MPLMIIIPIVTAIIGFIIGFCKTKQFYILMQDIDLDINPNYRKFIKDNEIYEMPSEELLKRYHKTEFCNIRCTDKWIETALTTATMEYCIKHCYMFLSGYTKLHKPGYKSDDFETYKNKYIKTCFNDDYSITNQFLTYLETNYDGFLLIDLPDIMTCYMISIDKYNKPFEWDGYNWTDLRGDIYADLTYNPEKTKALTWWK